MGPWEQRTALLRDIQSIDLWVDVPPAIAAKTHCRNAADDKFIHTALAAAAPWLITGDQDLLVLARSVLQLGVRISSPADAMASPEFPADRREAKGKT